MNIAAFQSKWLTPILPYLAVWAGLFLFHSAWLALIGFHVAIVIALLFIKPNIPINILFKRAHIRWIMLSVALCGSGGVTMYLLRDTLGVARDLPAQMQAIGLNNSNWLAFIAYFTLINPWIEEYYWRAALGSDSAKPFIGDAIYAGYHALILWGRVRPFSIIFALLALMFAGWFWRQLAREENSLLASALGHMSADFTILLFLYWMRS